MSDDVREALVALVRRIEFAPDSDPANLGFRRYLADELARAHDALAFGQDDALEALPFTGDIEAL